MFVDVNRYLPILQLCHPRGQLSVATAVPFGLRSRQTRRSIWTVPWDVFVLPAHTVSIRSPRCRNTKSRVCFRYGIIYKKIARVSRALMECVRQRQSSNVGIEIEVWF